MFELRLDSINKRFAHKIVLRDVSLSFRSGEIHSLLGENGAGKSTLAAIISGSVQPDSGSLFCGSRRLRFTSVRGAQKDGIAMVHQHPKLAEDLSLWENIALGNEKKHLFGLIDRRKEISETAAAAREWGFDLHLAASAGKTSAAERFYAALLAALNKKPHLLVLDEPSAALDPQQRLRFYKALTAAVSRGLCVLLITHNLEEALLYSSRISVLNKGVVVQTLQNTPKPVSAKTVQRLMFGGIGQKKDPQSRITGARRGKTLFRVRNLNVRAPNGVSLSDVHVQALAGDITVICGKNDGALKVLEDIFTGMYEGEYFGAITLRRKTFSRLSPAALRKAGAALIPSNKVTRASNPLITVYDMLVSLRGHDLSFAHRLVSGENIAIRLDEKVSHLSGGMLQRLILARELAQKPGIIILAEPAAGLDRQSEIRLWESLRAVADSGSAVIVLAGDIDGIKPFSDKIYMLDGGTLKEGAHAG